MVDGRRGPGLGPSARIRSIVVGILGRNICHSVNKFCGDQDSTGTARWITITQVDEGPSH